MAEEVPARAASTVVLLRDSTAGMETLLLRRNRALAFAGGLWVFPGGALDDADFSAAGSDDIAAAARVAAVREAREEAGVAPRADDMVLLSHWTTPVGEPRRFATWIFAAPLAPDAEVLIDGSEIHDACWLPLAEAVCSHEAGELGMLPPTYITLRNLCRYADVREMVAAERASPAPEILPIAATGGEGMTVMFRGDAGYEEGDATLAGARHRAIYRGTYWRYVYEGVERNKHPPLVPEP